MAPRCPKGKTWQERTGTNPCQTKSKSVQRDTSTRAMPSGWDELGLGSAALRMAESTAQFELGRQLAWGSIPLSNEPFLPQALIRSWPNMEVSLAHVPMLLKFQHFETNTMLASPSHWQATESSSCACVPAVENEGPDTSTYQ